MEHETDPLDRLFAGLEAELRADPALATELEASLAEYAPGARAAAAEHGLRRRHLEWFLLERPEPEGAATTLERLALRKGTVLDAAALATLRGSRASIFEVTAVVAGEGVWIADLGGAGEFPIADAASSRVLATGDLIAGRIFPGEGGVHSVSSGAAFVRDERVLEAVRADLERARASRRGVVRVGQRELEAMFWPVVAASADPVAAARALLHEGGLAPEEVEDVLADFADEPFAPEHLLPGAHDVLADALDRLAFDTSVDLEAARRVLLAAWAELANRGPGSGPSLTPTRRPETAPSGESTAAALARFEARRGAGEPLVPLLDDLERELGLDEEAEGDAEDEAETVPGEVAALVDEFLWQEERERGADVAERHAWLRALPAAVPDLARLEDLRESTLAAFAAAWLPDSGELSDADAARARVQTLSAFARWAETEQELPLRERLAPLLARLADSLPRIAQANQLRTRAAGPNRGSLYRIRALHGDQAELESGAGERREARLDPALAAWLRPEDRLRAALGADGRLAVYGCYPPEIALAQG